MAAEQFNFEDTGNDGLSVQGAGDGTDGPEVPKRKDPKEQKLCAVCGKEPCVPKFLYCKACKKDVYSCQNSAKADGREEDFKRLCKTPAGLRHHIAHYRIQCPSMGQGVPRRQMDWGQYLSAVYVDERTVKGCKEVYMDYPQYELHCKETKNMSAQDAMDKWAEMEKDPNADYDMKGRKDFEKRFAIPVEDYKLKESARGRREERAFLGQV